MLCTCALISGVVGNCVFQSCSETLSKAVLKLPKLLKLGTKQQFPAIGAT